LPERILSAKFVGARKILLRHVFRQVYLGFSRYSR
jgi:hypothetical protein